jgi:hypothetical protein
MYASKPAFLARFCKPSSIAALPKDMKTSYNKTLEILQSTRLGKGVFNIYRSGTAIGVSVVTALVINVLFIILMSYFSEVFIYLAITLFWVGNAGACYVFWTFYSKKATAIGLL